MSNKTSDWPERHVSLAHQLRARKVALVIQLDLHHAELPKVTQHPIVLDLAVACGCELPP